MKNYWTNPERNPVRRIPGEDLKISLEIVVIRFFFREIIEKIPEHFAKKNSKFPLKECL